MSRSTISTFQLFAAFPDEEEETARTYLEGRLWANGVTCPECNGKERITARKNGGTALTDPNAGKNPADLG